MIRLRRKANKPGNPKDRSVSSLRRDFRDDLITLGDAIISGVSHASADNNAEEQGAEDGQQASNASVNMRQSAESGSIGSIFRDRKRRRGSSCESR